MNKIISFHDLLNFHLTRRYFRRIPFNKTKPHEVQNLHKDSKGVVIGKGGVICSLKSVIDNFSEHKILLA